MSTAEETTRQQNNMNAEGRVINPDLARKMANEEDQYRALADESTSPEEVERVANEASESVFQQETSREFREVSEKARQEVERAVFEATAEVEKTHNIVAAVNGVEPQDLEETRAAGLKLVSETESIGAELLKELGTDFSENGSEPAASIEHTPEKKKYLSDDVRQNLQAAEREIAKKLAQEKIDPSAKTKINEESAVLQRVKDIIESQSSLDSILQEIKADEDALLETRKDLLSRLKMGKGTDEDNKEFILNSAQLNAYKKYKKFIQSKPNQKKKTTPSFRVVSPALESARSDVLQDLPEVLPPIEDSMRQALESQPAVVNETQHAEQDVLAELPPIEDTMRQAAEQPVEPPVSLRDEKNPLTDLPPIEETMRQVSEQQAAELSAQGTQKIPIETASVEQDRQPTSHDHDRWSEMLERSEARYKEAQDDLRKAQESGDETAISIAKKSIEQELVIERNIREKMKQSGLEVPPSAFETQVVAAGAVGVEVASSGATQEEKVPETMKLKAEFSPEQQERLERDFAEFGFTREDVESVDGFTDLTYGQQRLALENLKQLTLKEIQTKGILAHRDEKAKPSAWYKKVWQGITKKYQVAKEQKRAAGDMMKSEYLTLFKDVVAGTKETNLEVVEKEGDLEIQYLSGLENLSEAEQRRVQRFNEVATELSRMPYEWSLDTATPSERSRYEAVAAEYQSLLRASEVDLETGQETVGVIDLLKRGIASKTKEENAEAKITAEAQTQFGKIDNLVRLNQFLNTHPEVEEQLSHIKSAPAWRQVWKDIVTERGLYMVAGATVRSVAIGMLGSVAGVVGGAAFMGGLIARRRAGEQLREQDILARQGVKDESDTAKGMNVTRAVDADKEKKDLTIEEKGSLSRKIDYFIQRITDESDPENRLKLVKSLEARIDYTKQKIEQGLIDFGSSDERTANQYELINQLNLAENCVGLYNTEEKTGHLKRPELEERLEALMDARTQKVDKARRSFRNKQMAKGALYGAAFAGTGAAARWFYDHVSIDPFVRPGSNGGTEMGIGIKLGSNQAEQDVVSPEVTPRVPEELKPGRIVVADEISRLDSGQSAIGGPEIPSATTTIGGIKAPEVGRVGSSIEHMSPSTKPEVVTRLVDEIRNAGVKHDSIWKSAHELVQKNADTLGMKYPGPEGTKLSEAAWYNMKTSELVNELSQKTPGGIKDLIHEGDQITLSRGPDARFHLALEETSGMKAGRLPHIEDVTVPKVVPATSTEASFSSFDAHQMEINHSVNLPPQHGTDAEIAGLREVTHLNKLEKQLGVETVNPPQAPKEGVLAAATEQAAQTKIDAATPIETKLPDEQNIAEKITETQTAPTKPQVAETSEVISSSSAESTIKLRADTISGDIHFTYDANGNPEELSYDPDGLMITKATGREFVDATKTFDLARKHHLSEQTFRDQLSRDGLNLITKNTRIYDELRHAGEHKEADFVRQIIEHNAQEMEQKFGAGIIDQKKLADALSE